jgi:predicted permease
MWANLFRRSDVDSDLAAELAAYVDLLTEKHERAGLAPRDARRAALIEVGGVQSTTDATRDAWTGNALIVAVRETRQTVRALSRAPLYVVTTVLTLTIGIASATALVAIVKGSLLRPLPAVADPERLVSIEPVRGGKALYDFSYPDFEDLRKAPSLAGLALFDGTPMTLRDSIGQLRTMTSYVGGQFFSVLGVHPALGRLFDTSDVGPGIASPAVVISYDVWQRHFNASPSVIGAKIMLNATPRIVTGVAPKGFLGAMAMHAMDLWIPLSANLDSRSETVGRLVGRLAPGKSVADARAELTTIAERLAKEFPEENGRSVAVYAGAAMTMEERDSASRMPRILGIAIGLLLLITCANVANLSLMRTTTRRRELATRLALGASHASLVARVLLESVILAGIAAAAGIGLAALLLRSTALVNMVVDMDAMDLSLDWRVIALTAGLSLFAMLLVAVASVAESMRMSPESLLRDGGGAVRKRSLKQRSLVVIQLSASLVLLAAAGSVMGSVRRMSQNDAGLDARGVGMTFLSPESGGLDSVRQAAFYRDVLANVSRAPQVAAVALASTVPPATWVSPSRVFRRGEEPPPGTPLEKGAFAPTPAYVDVISPHFFDVLRIPLLTGRDFATTDDAATEHVAIVSKRLADILWPGESAIGKYVVRPRVTGPRVAMRVVGVVRDVRFAGLATEPAANLYIPYAQTDNAGNFLLVTRGHGDQAVPDTLVRDASRRLLPNADPGLAKRLTVQMNGEFAPQRRITGWLGAFGVIALVLAALGLYGVIAQDVMNRARELAVRSALGASHRRLITDIMADGARLTAAGVVIGGASSVAIVRMIRPLLIAINHFDALGSLSPALFLLGVALVATYVPARRLVRMDIVKILRAD